MGNALSFLDQSFDVHLLVEDWRTYYYLDRLFPTLPIKLQMIPVGGCKGVSSLVTASWQKAAQSPVHAFGLLDCDFGQDNVDRWTDRDTHEFRPQVHEVENFLLDWDAMASCRLASNSGKSAEEFRSMCLAKAQDILYDVSCANVIYELQSRYGDQFPKQPQNRKPSVHVSSLEDAQRFLTNDEWFQNRARVCTNLFKKESLLELLDTAVKKFKSALASPDDEWKTVFPGKEIFLSVLHNVYHGNVNADDMVKSIGEYQYDNRKIPLQLNDLMAELQRRKSLGWM